MNKSNEEASPSEFQDHVYTEYVNEIQEELEADPKTFMLLRKLADDLAETSRLMPAKQVQLLVRLYYQLQRHRVASGNQIYACDKEGDSCRLVEWAFTQSRIGEDGLRAALTYFVDQYRVGHWLTSICGIGPVIAAGLLSNLDVRNKEKSGMFHSFAGYNPERKWVKGEKRPFNAGLKKVGFFAGEQFVKVARMPKDYYGKLLRARKEMEWEWNLNGKINPVTGEHFYPNTEYAIRALKERNYKVGSPTYKWMSGAYSIASATEWLEAQRNKAAHNYEMRQQQKYWKAQHRAGLISDEELADKLEEFKETLDQTAPEECESGGHPMLCPDHVHRRACRWTIKLFLDHVHRVMYFDYYGKEPPLPEFLTDKDNMHRNYIRPPNFDPATYLTDFPGEPLSVLLDDEDGIRSKQMKTLDADEAAQHIRDQLLDRPKKKKSTTSKKAAPKKADDKKPDDKKPEDKPKAADKKKDKPDDDAGGEGKAPKRKPRKK